MWPTCNTGTDGRYVPGLVTPACVTGFWESWECPLVATEHSQIPFLNGKVPILDFTVVNLQRRQGIR